MIDNPPLAPRDDLSPFWMGWLLSLLSGILLVFSWPNFIWPEFHAWPGYLALVALVPWIWAWERSSVKHAFVYTGSMGFVFFMGCLYWILFLNRSLRMDNAIGWMFFSICGAIYFGLFGASVRFIVQRRPWPEILVLALGWTGWEYIRGHALAGGWPWGSLGHTQYANPWLRQLAVVSGVGGLSFLLVILNGLAAKLLRHPRQAIRALGGFSLLNTARSHPWRTAVNGLVLLGIAIWVGLTVYDIQSFIHAPGQSLQVAFIQGNLMTDQVWTKAYRQQAMAKMTAWHERAAARKPELIIWAESCLPGVLEDEFDPEWGTRLKQLIRTHGIPTVVTSTEYEPTYELEGKEYRHFNSAFWLDAQGQVKERYRKIRLVPLGEYIPYRWMERFLNAMVDQPIPMDLEPGDDPTVFPFGRHPFSVLICYEDVFETAGLNFARRGAKLFLALINESWVSLSAMQFQHAAISTFLAVENRVYIVRAAMSGPSGIIDPWGTWKQEIPPETEGLQWAQVRTSAWTSFFTRFGELFSQLCLAALILLFAVSLIPCKAINKESETSEKHT